MPIFHIGLLAAMPEELGNILGNLHNVKEKQNGDLKIYTGTWQNNKKEEILISTTWSGWGKVSAARATTRLCSHLNKNQYPNLLFFTGVAGAVKKNQKQWDIVVANSVLQHDMDARPLYKEFVIPALNTHKIFPNHKFKEILFKSLERKRLNGELNKFGDISEGLIATGDRFISDINFLEKLEKKLPELMAVEMEGGAFAQVAKQENIDWILLRVISDNANDAAEKDFNLFLNEYKNISWKLVEIFLNNL